MPTCWHCKAETTAAHYDRTVHNRHALHAEWNGWRMSGRFLIPPGKATRITPERLLGLLWEESARVRRTQRTDSPVAILPARERFAGLA